MKIDKSNPVQMRSMSRQKQKEEKKISTEQLSNISQAKKVVPIRSSAVISKDDATDSSMVNSAKVAEIKQAILEGRFKVNPEVIADRLLETVKELIQSKKNDKT